MSRIKLWAYIYIYTHTHTHLFPCAMWIAMYRLPWTSHTHTHTHTHTYTHIYIYIYIYTNNSLTPWKLTVPQLVKKSLTFYELQIFNNAFKRAHHFFPILRLINPVHCPPENHIYSTWQILSIFFVCFVQLRGILTNDIFTIIHLENTGFVKIVLVREFSYCFAFF